VSELVAALRACGLAREPVRVSDDVPVVMVLVGTIKVSPGSVVDSPGNVLKRIHPLLLGKAVTGAVSESSESVDSESEDSSAMRSVASDRVSQEAIGANLAFGGMSKLGG